MLTIYSFDFPQPQLNVKTLLLEDGRMIQAAKYGQAQTEEAKVELTEEEQKMAENIKVNIAKYRASRNDYVQEH